MRSTTIASAACLALAASSICADVNVTVSDLGVPNNAQAGTLSWGNLAGHRAYRVTFSETDPAAKIVGADFVTTTGINGPLHQHWRMSQGDKFGTIMLIAKTPQSTGGSNNTDQPAWYSAYDSHFIIDPAVATLGVAPTEDNDAVTTGFGTSPFPGYIPQVFPYPPEVLGWGSGTFLRGSWTINAAAQSNSLDVAYLVLPDGFFATGPQLLGTPVVVTTNGTFLAPIRIVPEPGAMLVVAGALLLARRHT